MDSTRKTPKDFTLRLTGLPNLSGDELEPVEDQLMRALKMLKIKVIGISVCWDYGEVEKDINNAAIASLNVESSKTRVGESAAATAETGVVTSWLSSFEKKW